MPTFKPAIGKVAGGSSWMDSLSEIIMKGRLTLWLCTLVVFPLWVIQLKLYLVSLGAAAGAYIEEIISSILDNQSAQLAISPLYWLYRRWADAGQAETDAIGISEGIYIGLVMLIFLLAAVSVFISYLIYEFNNINSMGGVKWVVMFLCLVMYLTPLGFIPWILAWMFMVVIDKE